MSAEHTANQVPGNTYQPPTTETERRIAGIWCAVLGVPEVSVLDNFFDLGGHSVLLHMVHEKLGPGISLVDLFSYPTVRGIAEYLDGHADGVDSSVDGGVNSSVNGGVDGAGRAEIGHRQRRDPARLRRQRVNRRPTHQG